MRHVQLHVAALFIGLRTLPLRHGTLQVVERDDHLDWELVLHTIEPEPVARSVHPLRMEVITGVRPGGTLSVDDLRGDAILVRTVENTIVFRGEGELVGFDRELLT